MKNALLSSVLLIAVFINGYSQPGPVMDQINRLMPKPFPASPNVASLGKYGDYQVDLFTGLPQISIPIFEVQSGGLKVPITLNYHASGVRVKDIAGWVGMGWSVSAGGQVSRKVNGQPDELYYANPNSPVLPAGAQICTNYHFFKKIVTGGSDAEPDIFSYSFPGKSGKFLAGQAGSAPYLFPYEPILLSYTPGLGKYEITDEQGVLYRFGKNAAGATAFESSNTSAGSTQLLAASAWHLMEMIAPNSDDQISFSYQDVGTANYTDMNNIISFSDNCTNNLSGQTCPTMVPVNTNIPSATTVTQKGLDEIVFETGKVKFFLNPTNRTDQGLLKSLDRIEIYSRNTDGTYKLLKTVKFNYSYFKNPTSTEDLALKLDKVQFLDAASVAVQNYKFSYFTNTLPWTSNSQSYNYARDYWGFYNGQTSNTCLIPATSIQYLESAGNPLVTISVGNANRNTNTQYLTHGTLKRIDYPTGGFTEFEFESNKYNDQIQNFTGGGIRVSKITSNDGGTSPAIVKTYKYGLGESGYGKNNFTEWQFNYRSEQTIEITSCFTGGGNNPVGSMKYRNRAYYSNSSYDMGGFNNAPVLYPYVTEYFGDASGANNGKIIYEYDNGLPVNAGVDLVIPGSTKYFRDDMSWKNGKLTRKTTYDNANHKLSEVVYTYAPFRMGTSTVGYGANYGTILSGDSCPTGYTCTNEAGEVIDQMEIFTRLFTQATGAYRRDDVKEYTYTNGDETKFILHSTSSQYHPDKLQVISSSIAKSNGEAMITENLYPFQLTTNGSSSGAALGVHMLKTKNVLSSPIETITYLTGSPQRIISGQITTYKPGLTAPATNYALPDQIYLIESGSVLNKASFVPVVVNSSNNGLAMDGSYRQRINFNEYDNYGNLKTVTKVNDGPTSYLYGYNNTLPVAEVKNALSNQVYYNGFEEATANVATNAKTGKKSSIAALSVILPSAGTYVLSYWRKPISSEWEYVETIISANQSIGGSGYLIDEVRLFPKGSLMTTYTYDPLVGMTSITPPNNQTSYYVYDNFSRLAFIKDHNGSIVKSYFYNYKK